jgi:hypothetical protein
MEKPRNGLQTNERKGKEKKRKLSLGIILIGWVNRSNLSGNSFEKISKWSSNKPKKTDQITPTILKGRVAV